MTTKDFRGPCPPWQVYKGHTLKTMNSSPGGLFLAGTTTSLTITAAGSDRPDRWAVSWKIRHDCGEVDGLVYMDDEELRRAFGLADGLGTFGQALADRISTPVDDAEQGKFVRAGRFLNIPHPGTGLQGDPNISIEIDGYMRLAILELLKHKATKVA